MKTKHVLLFLAVLLGVLVFVQGVGAMDSDHYTLDWYTLVNSAGGGPAVSTNFQVNLTIGQTPIQTSASSNYQISLGYWAGALHRWFQHLPLILHTGS